MFPTPCPALSRQCPAPVPPVSRPLSRPCPALSRPVPPMSTVPPCPVRPASQDNAEKFQHNKQLTRQQRLAALGAFRAPTNARRSFQPQYGPVKELANFGSMAVRGTDGSETLLKHALPVPRGSGEPVARLTRAPELQADSSSPGPVAPPEPMCAK